MTVISDARYSIHYSVECVEDIVKYVSVHDTVSDTTFDDIDARRPRFSLSSFLQAMRTLRIIADHTPKRSAEDDLSIIVRRLAFMHDGKYYIWQQKHGSKVANNIRWSFFKTSSPLTFNFRLAEVSVVSNCIAKIGQSRYFGPSKNGRSNTVPALIQKVTNDPSKDAASGRVRADKKSGERSTSGLSSGVTFTYYSRVLES